MEDLNKIAKTEKPIVEQKDSKKEPAGSIVINAPKVAVKRVRVSTKPKPAAAIVTKSTPVTAVKISTPDVETPKAEKQSSKKGKKTEEKIVVLKAPKKGKAETEPIVKTEVAVDLAEEKENPDSVKVIKKKAKKAEEKVDKLKKKVKKAKKKGEKKELKEKLGKAIEKLKVSVKELKKAKK
jgi:hypothetical protein